MTVKTTPTSMGYYMPAEWERHAATWLSWPYNPETWHSHIEGAEQAYAEIVSILTQYEHVHMCVRDHEMQTHAMNIVKEKHPHETNLSWHIIETGDVWFRDFGPIFIKNRGHPQDVAWTKWEYNAYGHQYDDLLIGNDVAWNMPIDQEKCFRTNIVLEGGSIEVNGKGTLLTTESCLLSPTRNPGLTKLDIERILKDFLGVTNIIWLSAGIVGDDTTGHIDTITRFVNSTTIVTSVEENSQDPNFEPLQRNLQLLHKARDEQGNAFTILHLPMPRTVMLDSRRMAASYANFYIANDVVLVPTYDQPSDGMALQTLQSCFPDRKVVGIDSRKLIWGYGSIHCATQQQPA